MDLVLIRHARPACGSDVCYGALDVPLAMPMTPSADRIREAALVAGHEWNLAPPAAILCSPAARARDTAGAVAKAWKLTVRHDACLREMDFGRWEGQRWDDVPRHELDQWAGDLLDARPHGGESARQAMGRVTACAERLLLENAQEQGALWLVGHAGPMRLLAAHWLGLELAETLQWPLTWGASCGFRLHAAQARQATMLWWNRAPA